MDCERAERLISENLDGRLPPADREALESHLEACPACARSAREAGEAERLLRALPGREPSPGFDRALAEKVASARPRSAARSWKAVAGRLASLAAGVAIGVALAGAYHVVRSAAPDPERSAGPAPAARAPEEHDGGHLVRLAGTELGRTLNTLEALDNEVLYFTSREPEAAPEILDREVRELDIPRRLRQVRSFAEVYRRRSLPGWRMLDGILSGNERLVRAITEDMPGRGPDPALLGDMRLRAERALSRIDPLRELFGSDFLPPVTVHVRRHPGEDDRDARGPLCLYINGMELAIGGQTGPAADVFRNIEKKFPGHPVARRAGDWTLLLYADAGRVRKDDAALRRVESLLTRGVRPSQATEQRLLELIHSLEKAGTVSPARLESLKIRIHQRRSIGDTLAFMAMRRTLADLETLTALAVNGRAVRLEPGQARALLGALRTLPDTWKLEKVALDRSRSAAVLELERAPGRSGAGPLLRAAWKKLEGAPGLPPLDEVRRLRLEATVR